MTTPAKPGPVHIKCKASASLLCNNLTVNDNQYLAYIHRNEIHIITGFNSVLTAGKANSTSLAKCVYAEKDPVSQAKYCNIGGVDSLVVVTLGGLVHMYDETGQKLQNTHKLQRSQVALSAKDSHLRGIAHDGKAQLFVGAGSGEIIVFGAKRLNLLSKLTGHSEPICDIDVEAKGNMMVSGDEKGTIILWERNSQGEFQQSCEFKGQGEPCLCIRIHGGQCIAAYSTGHIRIFDVNARTLNVEIAAHTRAITAMDLLPTANQFVVASEDTFLSSWSLPTAEDSKVGLKLSTTVNSSLLTGVAYCNGRANIAISSYDSRFISALPRPV